MDAAEQSRADDRAETLLITGVGGGAGQNVLKALGGCGYRLITADAEALATGLYAAEKGYLIPYAKSLQFIGRLLEICEKEQVKLLFPGLDAELPVLSQHREAFAKIGTIVAVSTPEVVNICDDKLATADFLQSRGFPYPLTVTLRECPPGELAFPLVLKPKTGGARSIGVQVVRTGAELARARTVLDETAYVAQEWIDGPEYTCGSVTLGGVCAGSILLRRILRDGDTYKAFVERNEKLERFVAEVATALQPFGACNFQLRVKDGIPYIFELNGRSSGTTNCRALAGFNEPRMMADYLLRGIAPAFSIRPITVLRYWNELVVENSDVDECRAAREVASRADSL